MKFPTYIFALLLLFTISCSNDGSLELEQASEPNFYALTIGNSWRYEYFERNFETNEFESANAFDEVEIANTAEINGNTYYDFKITTTGNNGNLACAPENGIQNKKFRDSLGYLIDEDGIRYFSYKDVNTEFYVRNIIPDFLSSYAILNSEPEDCIVSGGTFSCLRNELYGKKTDGTVLEGRNILLYSDGVGMIKESFSTVSNPIHFAERRLVSYNFNN